MNCLNPKSQVFQLNDKIISIDWGSPDGDKSVQVTAIKNNDGLLEVIEIKELDSQ